MLARTPAYVQRHLLPSIFPFSTSSRLSSSSSQVSSRAEPPNEYFRITLVRSAIALGEKKKGTLMSLGLRRRMQTVFHPFGPEVAGKILAVKELLKVENVPRHAVRTQTEQRKTRKASRGYDIVGFLKSARDIDAEAKL